MAVFAVAAAIGVRSELLPFLGSSLPFATFLPAVLAVFLFSGVSAGVLATFLSICYVSYYQTSSLSQILIIHGARETAVALFSITTCVLLCLVARMLHNYRKRAQEAEHQAWLAEQRALIDADLRETELRYQGAILALNVGLEQRVRERTAELEAAIHEQESFSYTVSHDLRAPLRHINSFSTILLEDYGTEIPDQARNYLERIKGATRSMGSLIDHLLELSRLSRTALIPELVDLSQLVAGIITMLQETEPQRRVEVCCAEGITVRGDRDLLRQLLINLLGNAWKYSSRQPLLRLEFGRSWIDGQETFFVRDNGVGFDMAYSDKLFEVFQRLHGTQFEGTGIGLATAQRIVQRHGGTIWAQGEVGAGATFYFTLSEAKGASRTSPSSACARPAPDDRQIPPIIAL